MREEQAQELMKSLKGIAKMLNNVLGPVKPEAPKIQEPPPSEPVTPVCTKCGRDDAMVCHEDGWVCHHTHPRADEPPNTGEEPPVVEDAGPELTEENIKAEAAKFTNMNEFSKHAKKLWNMNRANSRMYYKKFRESTVVRKAVTKEIPELKVYEMDLGKALKKAAGESGPVEPKVFDNEPVTESGLPPKIDLYQQTPKIVHQTSRDAVIDMGPEEGRPPVTPGEVFTSMNTNLKDMVLTSGENDPECLEAVKFVHEKLGFDLVPSKQWVDMIRSDKPVKEIPPELRASMEAFAISFRVGTSFNAPKFNPNGLHEQVQELRKDAIAKEMDPDKGKAQGQRKIDLAGDNKQMLVQVARRIARDLAKNGPITIDDVTEEMGKQYNVLPLKDGKRHAWKGSVFNKSEWVYVGSVPSRQSSANARPVGMWALKTWLKENTLNGKNTLVSSFIMSKLYKDFKHLHPKQDMSKCNCYLGEECLSEEIRDTIVKSDNKFYEVPVSWIPGSVGAMIVPPNPALNL